MPSGTADRAADARSVGRDLADAIRAAQPTAPSEPVLFTTDDEISEGSAGGASPVAGIVRRLHMYETVEQPNHIETLIAEIDVDGEPHLIKFSRYHDDQQFWTVPGERDERPRGRHTDTVTEPDPDENELYDLTDDPIEARNLAHPGNADDRSRALQQTMLTLLHEQLAAKRLTPSAGEVPGYRPPAVPASHRPADPGEPETEGWPARPRRPSTAEDTQHALDRALAVRARSGAHALVVDHPEVPQHPALECARAHRLDRQKVGEHLELLLVVDGHAEHLARLGELGLQVAGVAEAEGSLGVRAVIRLAQCRAERVRADDPDRSGGRR